MNSSLRPALFRCALGAGATAGGILLLGAGIADAHVSVDAPGAAQGGYAVLSFRVPTESDTAGTTKLTIALPGFASARTEPLPGWTSVVDKNGEAKATAVTWTADPGVSVGPGQFQRFAVSVGPLPDQSELTFPATQTYSDGQVVEWNQPMNPDGSEPEHPAPELTLTATGGDDHHATATDDADRAAGHSDTDGAESAHDNTARWLGGIGLVLGALGAALGIGALRRRA